MEALGLSLQSHKLKTKNEHNRSEVYSYGLVTFSSLLNWLEFMPVVKRQT